MRSTDLAVVGVRGWGRPRRAGRACRRSRNLLSAPRQKDRRRPWHIIAIPSISPAFERTSKRRRGYPSETSVKRGLRFVHGDKELVEKLGRNDPCPCGSGLRFQAVLP
ncbi:SEC-C metal-binding domain-containing protein [Sphingobium ummariense]|uniref:SEC-C metal-binding domain-containing protein n=1 Tax=Sphingobium ummariense TaxID=420994 RepID=UPI000A0364C0